MHPSQPDDLTSGASSEEPLTQALTQTAQEIERDSRAKRLRRGLTASVLTLGALTLVLEIGLRVTGDRSAAFERGVERTYRRWVELMQGQVFEEVPDNVRRYAMRPGAECVVDGWTFRVTRHRTRGEDFPAEKPAGEKRLLALGDSFCFGMWADEDETLVGHLAAMANARERELGSDVTWRAVNLGVPGYHSGQQLRALEQDGLPLEPDAVLLYYNTNDIDRHGFFFDEDLGSLRNDHLPLPVTLRRVLWKTSHLYGWIARKHNENFNRIPSSSLDERVPWAHVREDNKVATRASLERIVSICRERDIPLFFVNQPLMSWSADARREDWPVLELVDWAEEIRTELDVPGINLLGWMRNYADGVDRFPAPPDEGMPIDQYFADEAVEAYLAGEAFVMPEEPDFHLNGDGYGHIARLVYPKMQEAEMLP